jgi:hypothetical protein
MDERIVKALEDMAIILRRGFQAQMAVAVAGCGFLLIGLIIVAYQGVRVAQIADGNTKLMLEVLHRLPQ